MSQGSKPAIRIFTVIFPILLFVVTGVPTQSFSNETEPAEQSVDEASLHFRQGIEFYKQQKFEAAAIEFGRAYELKPSYKILYNIAQSENMLEHYAAALTAYRTYLSQGGSEIPTDRKLEIQTEIDRLVTRVGYLDVQGAVDGAAVIVDGEERGTTPLKEPITVDIGKREVEVTSATTRLYRRILKVAGGQHLRLNLSSNAETAKVPKSSPPSPNTPEPALSANEKQSASTQKQDRPRKIVGAMLLGVGLACGATGAVTGGISVSNRKSIENKCDETECNADVTQSDFDTVQHLSISTDVLLGTAVASFTTGLILLVVKSKHEQSAGVSAAVIPAENGAFAAISGRFCRARFGLQTEPIMHTQPHRVIPSNWRQTFNYSADSTERNQTRKPATPPQPRQCWMPQTEKTRTIESIM